MSETNPQGVIVIIVEPDGHVCAVGTDFSEGTPTGCTQRGAQESRASEVAWRNVFRSRCSSPINDAILDSPGDRRSIQYYLMEISGWKKFVKAIGYEEE